MHRSMRQMKRFLPWIIAAALLLALVLLIAFVSRTWPARARFREDERRMGGGSEEYARLWRKQLLACQSLDEVKRRFNCFLMEWDEGGAGTRVNVTKPKGGRPWALIKSFPDGRWIACAHASSHGVWGGGTVVTRDSSGEIHIFFGHVCGWLYAKGETLEEFCVSLRGYRFGLREVFLKE
jgi:hypothetical protein